MKYVDIFSGLGGFNVALTKLGHKCVFACEINPELQKLYGKNFSIVPFGDITKINESEIPKHQILCAGFPCQPFSKAESKMDLMIRKTEDYFWIMLLEF